MAIIFAIVDAAGIIVSRTVGESDPPAGHTAVEDRDYAIGGTLIEGVYTPPYQEPPLLLPTTSPQELLIFSHENRLRVVEGKPPLTLEDFRVEMNRGA